MTDRLAEIAERERKARLGPRVETSEPGAAIRSFSMAMPPLKDAETFHWHAPRDCRWLLANINAARAFIDRILDGHENSQQLLYLRRIQNILAGTDDGLPASGKEPNDGV